eukprot:3056070-Rhodomonas_salina.2
MSYIHGHVTGRKVTGRQCTSRLIRHVTHLDVGGLLRARGHGHCAAGCAVHQPAPNTPPLAQYRASRCALEGFGAVWR